MSRKLEFTYPFIARLCFGPGKKGRVPLVAHISFSKAECETPTGAVEYGFREIEIGCSCGLDFLPAENRTTFTEIDVNELFEENEIAKTSEDSIQMNLIKAELKARMVDKKTRKKKYKRKQRPISHGGSDSRPTWTFKALESTKNPTRDLLDYSLQNETLGQAKCSKDHPVEKYVRIRKRHFHVTHYESKDFVRYVTKRRFLFRAWIYKQIFGAARSHKVNVEKIKNCDKAAR
jgi:hypothetical protein